MRTRRTVRGQSGWCFNSTAFPGSRDAPGYVSASERSDQMAARLIPQRPKTRFLVTIDVETMTRGNVERDILGAIPGWRDRFGVERMMDLLESRQVRGTFFLNVYDVAKHGEDSIAKVARLIQSRGHDLELHTHPRPMYPFYGISRAPFEEQVEILEKGISLIEKWTGRRPVAHRAGAFLANLETLRAMDTVGLQVDSSLAPGSRMVLPLVGELGASNVPRRVGSVWEVPVTYFDQLRFGPWRSRRTLDIEGCSLAEIKTVTRWAVLHGYPTVCLLMHSFSFSRHGKPGWRVIRRFEALLAWLERQEGIEFATAEQAGRWAQAETAARSPVRTPRTGIWMTWARALGSWNDGWKNFLVACTGLACLAAFAAGVVLAGYVFLK